MLKSLLIVITSLSYLGSNAQNCLIASYSLSIKMPVPSSEGNIADTVQQDVKLEFALNDNYFKTSMTGKDIPPKTTIRNRKDSLTFDLSTKNGKSTKKTLKDKDLIVQILQLEQMLNAVRISGCDSLTKNIYQTTGCINLFSEKLGLKAKVFIDNNISLPKFSLAELLSVGIYAIEGTQKIAKLITKANATYTNGMQIILELRKIETPTNIPDEYFAIPKFYEDE